MKTNKLREDFKKKFRHEENANGFICESCLGGKCNCQLKDIWQFIETAIKAERKILIGLISNENLIHMESCEPDCDKVRHARHEGSWNHYVKMDEYLEKLKNENK